MHPQAAGNVPKGRIDTGVAAAFARAAEVVEIEIRSRRQCALPLEARGAHAVFDAATGRVTLTASVQMPHMLRTGLADVLGIRRRICAWWRGRGRRVRTEDGARAGICRRSLGRPRHLRREVVIEDRSENLTASFHSRDHHYFVRGAFDAEARLLAVDADLRCNVGAYSLAIRDLRRRAAHGHGRAAGPVRLPGLRRACPRHHHSNTCPMAPYRGVCRPAITLAMERLMDCAAARFGLDPLEIRRRNLVQSFPYRTATGLTYDEGSYRQALELAAERIDLAASPRAPAGRPG